MTQDDLEFPGLRQELEIWREAQLELPIWWRDDDAVAATPELDRLTALSEDLGVPLHLAVIPAGLDPSLPLFVAQQERLSILVHGWQHVSHAVTGKKCEFGPDRPLQLRLAEAAQGLDLLRDAFGSKALPVFVPPWNRISSDLVAQLVGVGYQGLSTFTPRTSPQIAPGLTAINTHLDVIDWRGSRSAVAAATLDAQAVALLQARRLGAADNTEPLGVLTHHLVHDAAIWNVTQRLFEALQSGPVSYSFCRVLNREAERSGT